MCRTLSSSAGERPKQSRYLTAPKKTAGATIQRHAAKKLKTFRTSLGFYDLAVAAPSMKAALEAWGSKSNLFHQGLAKEATDDKVIAATMAKPGVVLQRPVGSHAPFREHAALPTAASLYAPQRTGEAKPEKATPAKATKIDGKAERRAAIAFQKEQERRERQRQEEKAAATRENARRQAALEKAQRVLAEAQREHDRVAAAIEQERAAVQQRADVEQERWAKLKERLEQRVRKASE